MFYIQPPKGVVALNRLEECVSTRLEYLGLLYDDDTEKFGGNFEYLLEGSAYDRIGHFTLRLLSLTSEDLRSYWICRETLLLKQRLLHLSRRQLHRMFRSIIKQTKVQAVEENLIHSTLLRICTSLLQTEIFHHISADDHASNLRFELVPDLIQSRIIDVEKGFGIISCSKWKSLLQSLFQTLVRDEKLKHESTSIKHSIMDDPRLSSIYRKIERQLCKEGIRRSRITAENIDLEARKFPLCMSNLHFTLRYRHRLTHHARFHYSLFLKDCGMKMDQAVVYWKQEYSKTHTCTSICSHNWQTDSRKFMYSIRHLYGLEGSRKNYKSPNCKAICNESPGPRYEGGCPFKEFDRNTLRKLLSVSMTESEVQEYLDTTRKQRPEVACTALLKMKCKTSFGNRTVHSPVQYYTMITEPDEFFSEHGRETV